MHFSLKKKQKKRLFLLWQNRRELGSVLSREHMSSEQLFIESVRKHEIAEASGGEHVSGGVCWQTVHLDSHTLAKGTTLSLHGGQRQRRGVVEKEYEKKKSGNYDRKSERTGWHGLCGRAAEAVQVPGLFWCTFVCKISISRRQITIAQRPSNDPEDRCEDILSHCQSKQSGY